jgi:hypothetical protein
MKLFGQARRLSRESVQNLIAPYLLLLQYNINTIQQKRPKNLGLLPIPFVIFPKPLLQHNTRFYNINA